MKNILFILFLTILFASCNSKTSLDLTIIETGTGIPIADAQVDIIQVNFGGTLGNPSTSSVLLESVFTDENGEIRFRSNEEFDKIEVEITKDGYFDVIPDNNPRYGFFDLGEGDQVDISFEMDPEALLEFRIIDDPLIEETGITLNTTFPGSSLVSHSSPKSIVDFARGGNFHYYIYRFSNTLGLMRDSILIDPNITNIVNLYY